VVVLLDKEKSSSFIKNAAILSAAGIISRMIGAVYRIPLYRLISNEGIGLYQMGYYVYNVLLALSATGIPVAISKLVSEEISKDRMGEARRVFKVATTLLTAIGLSVTIIMMLSAPFISEKLIKEPRAYYPLMAVAPAIVIVALMASFRGFFQGLQKMWPTAVSQLLEQVGRVVTVLILAYYLVSIDAPIEHTAAGASFGAVAGSLVGLAAVIFIYFKQKKYIDNLTLKYPDVSERSNKQLIKRILQFSIPITLGAMIIPVMNGIDTFLVPRRLQAAGFAVARATEMYGDLTGAAIPLINLPSMLAAALATSLVPTISHASALGLWDVVKQRAGLAIKIILIIGIPAAFGLSVLSKQIVLLLYGSTSATSILQIVAFAVIFLTLHQTCTGILQGLGHAKIPVRNLIIGGIAKVILNFILTGIPAINIHGAAIASIAAYGIASILNVKAVGRYSGYKIDWMNTVFKPVFAAIVMSVFAKISVSILTSLNMGNVVVTLISVGFAAIIYGLVLMLSRVFSREEYLMIPVIGKKSVDFVSKLRMLR
jgi:stage V sporulation protein B